MYNVAKYLKVAGTLVNIHSTVIVGVQAKCFDRESSMA